MKDRSGLRHHKGNTGSLIVADDGRVCIEQAAGSHKKGALERERERERERPFDRHCALLAEVNVPRPVDCDRSIHTATSAIERPIEQRRQRENVIAKWWRRRKAVAHEGEREGARQNTAVYI